MGLDEAIAQFRDEASAPDLKRACREAGAKAGLAPFSHARLECKVHSHFIFISRQGWACQRKKKVRAALF